MLEGQFLGGVVYVRLAACGSMVSIQEDSLDLFAKDTFSCFHILKQDSGIYKGDQSYVTCLTMGNSSRRHPHLHTHTFSRKVTLRSPQGMLSKK